MSGPIISALDLLTISFAHADARASGVDLKFEDEASAFNFISHLKMQMPMGLIASGRIDGAPFKFNGVELRVFVAVGHDKYREWRI